MSKARTFWDEETPDKTLAQDLEADIEPHQEIVEKRETKINLKESVSPKELFGIQETDPVEIPEPDFAEDFDAFDDIEEFDPID